LLRGFLFDEKAEKTYVHRRNGHSFPKKICDVLAQRYFYGRLDGKITKYENRPATFDAYSHCCPILLRESPMSLHLYLAFVAACIALALIPGPVVTLVIANGLRYGTRAALTNIAGVQAGLAIVIGIVAVGLTSLMATMGYWFDWVRFAGAAYLVWLGIRLIRFPVEGVKADAPPPPPRGGFFLQGFVVLLSNPKVMVFFGAFIPQFMDMGRDHFPQVVLLGVTFMVTGAITDTIYALLAGRARKFFSARRTRLLSRVSGGFMIGGGLWLALTRAR
jgi:threonine/homoserine/homoserine lactone efflux protein